MALAGYAQTAFQQLPPIPLNFSGDPLQTTQAVAGLLGNLASWTLRVANALNLLIPNGGAVPVSQGGTGLTSGVSGGIPYFSSTTTMASSALLQASGVVLGGGAGAAPFTAVGASTPPAILSYNAVTNLPSIIGTPSGHVLTMAAADGTSTGLELAAGAGNVRITGYRANTQLGSPTALNANDVILSLNAQGHDGTNRSVNSGSFRLSAASPWTTTDHGSYAQIIIVGAGTLTTFNGGVFRAPADGGCQLAGTTAADNAPTSALGEFIEQIILLANEVNINTPANVASITLTPGDWDVFGELWVDNNTGGATLTGNVRASISQTSATHVNVPATGVSKVANHFAFNADAATTTYLAMDIGTCRINVNANTTVYLVGSAAVTAGNAFGYGKISARRVR